MRKNQNKATTGGRGNFIRIGGRLMKVEIMIFRMHFIRVWNCQRENSINVTKIISNCFCVLIKLIFNYLVKVKFPAILTIPNTYLIFNRVSQVMKTSRITKFRLHALFPIGVSTCLAYYHCYPRAILHECWSQAGLLFLSSLVNSVWNLADYQAILKIKKSLHFFLLIFKNFKWICKKNNC